MTAFPWSDWRPLASGVPPPSAEVLAEILDGGQAFRWNRRSDGSWLGGWAGCVAEVRRAGDRWQWRAPAALQEEVAREIGRYFAVDEDHAALADVLPWRSDPHLARCLQSFPGLRILRQPFGETLLGFLCSATKQIVQIKQMLALLAARHGRELVPGFNRLPAWPELAQLTEAELRACRLGFRAGYIHRTARFLAAHPDWLGETETLPYPEAKARLCALPGVGEKVADCVLLFGAGRLEAFPVDVWILRTMATRYPLSGWKSAHVAQFGRTHFGPLAGLAQQYLFAFERRTAGR
jgi:N-glycosylase/DNA lyase